MSTDTPYAGYLRTIGDKFSALLGEIRTDYNFDLGDEFEIAICKALRFILPSKYGVCRGTIFTIDNRSVGDDIIVFDQWRFPALRLLDDNHYAQKQRIPIEAVVAYIEAKNTIILEDGHGNSLSKALYQATEIKRIGRAEKPLNPFVTDIENLPSLGVATPKEYPQIDNPLYTCIFTRGVRETAKSAVLDSNSVNKALIDRALSSGGQCIDLLIANEDVVVLPVVGNIFHSPFWVMGQSTHFRVFQTEGLAWGLGISLMFLAFESIRLGSIDWKGVIGETLQFVDNRKKHAGGE